MPCTAYAMHYYARVRNRTLQVRHVGSFDSLSSSLLITVNYTEFTSVKLIILNDVSVNSQSKALSRTEKLSLFLQVFSSTSSTTSYPHKSVNKLN